MILLSAMFLKYANGILSRDVNELMEKSRYTFVGFLFIPDDSWQGFLDVIVFKIVLYGVT